ncbi:MAG: phage major capsid protein [Sphingomonas sp.]|uniref:phage major capsid protein n=1 Tax=Sphingomonas sp. TaxID=28214 RepID=UPI003F819416
MTNDLLSIVRNRQPAEVVLKDIKNDNLQASLAAGQKLVQNAKNAQLNVDDYLRLAVNPEEGQFKGAKFDGFEAALAFLGLPVRDDFSKGIVLQAASETFQTYPGTRAMFPQVIDNILQWKYRQDQLENVENLIAQSRTINGVEMITTVVNDQASDYQQTGVIAEGGRIPIRSLRTTEKSVKFFKFGGGIEFTYEFERRASLDLVTPYAARQNREVAIGQAAIATSLLFNGDGVNAAAPVTNAATLAATLPTPPTTVAGRINWEVFLAWLVQQAKAGTPIDTVVGNWDMYLEWQRMFATPTANAGASVVDNLRKAGVNVNMDIPSGFLPNISFAISSTAPAAKILGMIKNETVEELVENGSDIEESVRAIENQKVRYVKTVNKGYRLIFGDTRSVLNLN